MPRSPMRPGVDLDPDAYPYGEIDGVLAAMIREERARRGESPQPPAAPIPTRAEWEALPRAERVRRLRDGQERDRDLARRIREKKHRARGADHLQTEPATEAELRAEVARRPAEPEESDQ